MSALDFRVSELERKLHNLIRFATIIEADYERALVRVKDGDLETSFLPWVTQRANGAEALWDAPEVGERVILFSPSGETGAGVVFPAIYCSDNPAGEESADVVSRTHSDGATFAYDRAAHLDLQHLPDEGVFRRLVGNTLIEATQSQILLSVNGTQIEVTDGVILLKSDSVLLGGTGGKKIARIGDAVDPNTFKIVEGSDVTKST